MDLEPAQGIPRSYRTACQAVLLFSAPLLMGGVHRTVVLVLAWLCILFLAAMALHARAAGRRLEVPWIAWVMVVLTFWTGFQLVPLPSPLLGLLAPSTAELYRFVLGDLAGPVADAWRALSLEPQSTALELTKLAGLTALVVASANTHRRPASRETLVFLLAIAGGLVALLALSGVAAESHDYLGLYEPRCRWDPRVAHGPFVNPNHLAGFLGLCAFAAFGFAAIPRQQRGQGAFAATLGALCLGGIVLSGSRGALVAFALTLPLLIVLLYAVHRGRRPGLLPAAICLVVVLVGGLSYPRLADSLSFLEAPATLTEDQKIRSWPGALALIRDNPLAGTGRGAFAQAHTRYKTLPVNIRFTHVENEPLQALADWGIPFGALAVGAFVLFWLQLLRRELRSIDAGLVAGLAFLGLHNLVDFNLEFYGVGLPAAIVLGLLARSPRRHGRSSPAPAAPAGGETSWSETSEASLPSMPVRSRGRLLPFLRHRWPLPVALGLLALSSWPLLLQQDAATDLAALRKLAQGERLDRSELVQQATAALDRQPAEYLVPLLVARACMPQRRPRPEVPPDEIAHWLNKATYLAPTAPGVHLLTARLLAATGRRSQALLEYRTAAGYGAPLGPLVRELTGLKLSYEELLEALPPGPDELRLLAGALLERKRWEDADRAFSALAAFPASRLTAATQRAALAIDHLRGEGALDRCRELLAIAPDSGYGHHLLGQAQAQRGQWREAAASFGQATRLEPKLDKAWAGQLAALARLGEWDALSDVLAGLRSRGARSGRTTATYHRWHAQLALHHGNLAKAIISLSQAVQAEPTGVDDALLLASLQEKIGDHQAALAALRTARQRSASPAIEQRIQELLARHPRELLPAGAGAQGAGGLD